MPQLSLQIDKLHKPVTFHGNNPVCFKPNHTTKKNSLEKMHDHAELFEMYGQPQAAAFVFRFSQRHFLAEFTF